MAVRPLTENLMLSCAEMEQPDLHALPGGAVAVFSHRSPDKDGPQESPNEDAVAVITAGGRRVILAIADGMGGQPGGAQASATALEALMDSIDGAAPDEGGLRSAIIDGFECANERVSRPGIGAGTTLTVAEIDDLLLRPYHVGDSPILVVGQRGAVRLLTVAHSPVGYAVEAGLLDESDAIHHADRHLISNIVGTPAMRIEVGATIRLRPRDTAVLGSDGLFDNMHVAEIVECARKGPLPEVARRLLDTCRERMLDPRPGVPSKKDDLSFLIYRPGPASP